MTFFSRRDKFLRIVATLAMLSQQFLFAPLSRCSQIYADDGAVVVGGGASIVHSGTTLDITTQTDRTVINWNQFNIDAGSTMNFNQPGINSAVLNRVITPNNPSAIFGTLNSNGNVYLVNPSGVVVGSSGVINTNGFTASVLDISTDEFMRGGVLNFRGDSNASIINQGKIYTGTGGTTLIGGTVINEGLIESNGGSINLLTGGSVTLKGGGVYTQADQATLINGISETSGLIKNSGTLRATGALEVGGEVYLVSPGGTVIQEAIIAASKNEAGGNVVVDAGKGNATVSGSIDVQGKTGGTVTVTGKQVELQNAMIDASGENGGGTINIGGGFQGNDASITNSQSTFINANSILKADAGVSGDGGTVIIWSDGATDYFGTVSNQGSRIGAGGFTEVSGKASLNFAGSVNTGGGDLLLDPFSYTIDATAAGNILTALGTNNVTIQTTTDVANFGSSGNNTDAGDIIVNASILWDSPNSLTMLAHRDIRFNASVQNRNVTSGDLNIVAGWDGTTAFNLNDFVTADVTNTTLFGNNNGSVLIGDGTQTSGVAVGSRSGNTNVFGYDVRLQAGTGAGADGRFSQLGFQISDGVALGGFDLDPTSADGANVIVDGDITVHSINDVTAFGGDTSRHNYVKVGHVGTDQARDFNAEASVGGEIEMVTGRDITFKAGGGFRSYAQLGHGGYDARGINSGKITISQANNINFSGGTGYGTHAQLGHSTYSAWGNHSGAIIITQANNISFIAGTERFAFSQLGHRGIFRLSDQSGTITIDQANDINFIAGNLKYAYTKLGHGGVNSRDTQKGAITINYANNINFIAGSGSYASAQLGHGGYRINGFHEGVITIKQSNDIKFIAGAGFAAYAQLGHGGYDADGGHSGVITLIQVNNVTFSAGTGAFSYVKLGQGGAYADGNHNGVLTITKANNITFTGGEGGGASAQLGNGGSSSNGKYSGAITIEYARDITFIAGGGSKANAQLGNGGSSVVGKHSGVITVSRANDITFSAGAGERAYAQFGNGGDSGSGSYRGAIRIKRANNLVFSGGSGFQSYVRLGQGGTFSGNHTGAITITQANDISFSSGSGSFSIAQLGNGGLDADGNHKGVIDVTLEGNLILTGQNSTFQYALLGHGDNPGDSDAGNTVSGDITLRVGGSATLTNAYIGHLIDADGIYTSGKTQIAIGTGDFTGGNLTDQLVADNNSQFFSAPTANGGELRFYLPRESSFQAADGTKLNGVDIDTFIGSLPNRQGTFQPFNGPYNINTVDGNFAFYLGIIELIVNANSGTSIYGDTPINPGLDLFSGTLFSGDTLAGIGLANNFSLTAGSNAGTYTLSVDATNLDPSYTLIGSTSGTFTINPADLTITATAQNKIYGDLFTFSGNEFTAAGLRNGDAINTVALNSLGSPVLADAGTYDINATAITSSTSFDANNYNITFDTLTNGFTVNPADLTITATDVTKEITNLIVLDGTTGFTTSGLKNSETVTSVTLASTGTPATALVGTYSINASNPLGSLDVNNYDITFVEGTLTVEPFSALVDVDNLTQDTFSRYQNYFNSADSLVKPTGPGNINWIGLPGSPNEAEQDSSPIEEGTIPFEIRINSLQASN